jgi:hypothetical protein
MGVNHGFKRSKFQGEYLINASVYTSLFVLVTHSKCTGKGKILPFHVFL